MNEVVLVYPSISYKGGVERVISEVLKFLVAHGVAVRAVCSDMDPSLVPLCSEVVYKKCKDSTNPVIAIWLRLSWMIRAANQIKPYAGRVKVISAPCALLKADIVMAGSCHLAAQSARLSKGAYKWLLNPKHWFYIFCEFRIFRTSSTVLVPSTRTRGEIKRYYSFAKSKTYVMPHGVDLQLFSPDKTAKAALANTLGIDERATILLTVTNEIKRKGCFQVLEGLRLLKPQFPQLHYVVAGRDNPEAFIAAAHALCLEDTVTVLPGVHGEALAHLYQGADIFVLPTEYESFGLVGIEALACGIPVLTTQVGGLEDYVTDGVDGLFVERTGVSVAEGLRRFLGLDVNQQCLMVSKAREKAESYSWSEVLKPLLAFVGAAKT